MMAIILFNDCGNGFRYNPTGNPVCENSKL